MRLFLSALALAFLMAAASGTAQAGQKVAQQSAQMPPMTIEQLVSNCAITGVLFGGFSLFKPMMAALNIAATAVLHDAVYGCGIGVISGVAVQGLVSMIPMPPQPSPFDAKH
ncbi:MAG: hypothetical protein WCF85_02135 [Rhodospirillaceae bacterium]